MTDRELKANKEIQVILSRTFSIESSCKRSWKGVGIGEVKSLYGTETLESIERTKRIEVRHKINGRQTK